MTGKRAFTLIELLLVLLLLGSVMSVILACFDGGFRVYSRVSAFGSGEVDVYLAGETIERDLRNAIDLKDPPFRGDADGMEFATVLYGTGGEARPAVVSYRRLETGAGVTRSVAFLPANTDGHESTETKESWLASDYRLALTYLEGDNGSSGEKKSGTGVFLDLWPEGTNLPAAVRIEVSGGRLTEEGSIIRTVGVAAPGGGRNP